ncbi:MAG: DnaJ domain-containing protein [Actinobacteria bacterium]|nr:DnaJ domain-containing protein [Actinomycetota bacterium]
MHTRTRRVTQKKFPPGFVWGVATSAYQIEGAANEERSWAMAKDSFYDILGLARSASAEEIKKAFRKLARKHHPDTGGDEETFKKINEAYEVLSDPEKKKNYDQLGRYTGGIPFGGYGGTSRDATYRGYPGGDFIYNESTPSGWSEIFDSIRNGEGAFGSGWEIPTRPQKGQELQVTLEVDFEEAFHGVTKKVTIRIPSTGEKQTMNIKVPAGAIDGGKLRYRNKGEFGTGKGERGDLVVVTKIKPHQYFERDGADVILNLPVSIAEASLGTQIVVPTPDGGRLKIKVPAGSHEGKILRVKNKGAKKIKEEGYGDLRVRISVVIPKDLNEEQRLALEAFEEAGKNQKSIRAEMEKHVTNSPSGDTPSMDE